MKCYSSYYIKEIVKNEIDLTGLADLRNDQNKKREIRLFISYHNTFEITDKEQKKEPSV